MAPRTRYVKSGDVNIAYQVIGDGPMDLVFIMGWVSHLDYFWQEPSFARFLRRLASFSRLIVFDKRGTGLSDRVTELPTIEERMDDVRAVLDAVDSDSAALLGTSEGGAMSAVFAATYPERTRALIMVGSYARRHWAPDYPWAETREETQRFLEQIEHGWGGPVGIAKRAPGLAADPSFRNWWATYLRMSASPGAALALTRMNFEIDIRPVLPTIHVPTLIVHRTGDMAIPVEGSRYMAERIPGARYVELPGNNHLLFLGDQDAILDEIEEFLTGARGATDLDTVLTTVLMTQIIEQDVRGLARAVRHDLLETFRAMAFRELGRFRGREIETVERSPCAAFDGPARAVRCASAISSIARQLGLQVGVGVHTGEIRLVGGRMEGAAVDTGSRIAGLAGPGDVLASSTVKDLVAGSGISFEEYGTRALASGRETWSLYRVVPPGEIRGIPPAIGPDVAEAHAIPLSRREQEVATLIALGLSNRQIADELIIAETTAERHVANILNKLGYHSRTQVAAWAVERGLTRGNRVSHP